VIECLPNKCEASNRHPLLTPTQKMAASLWKMTSTTIIIIMIMHTLEPLSTVKLVGG
jgi:hypothetical protein